MIGVIMQNHAIAVAAQSENLTSSVLIGSQSDSRNSSMLLASVSIYSQYTSARYVFSSR